jgi:integrase
MRVEDYFADGKRWRLRLNEKGGKVHEMPAHHNLEAYLDMHAAGLFGAKGTPLFRSADWHGGGLTTLPMHRIDVWRMIRRRAEKAGIDADMCCHTFRATGLTNFLANGGTLETPKRWPTMPAHARRSSMIAPATKSRWTRLNGSRSNTWSSARYNNTVLARSFWRMEGVSSGCASPPPPRRHPAVMMALPRNPRVRRLFRE